MQFRSNVFQGGLGRNRPCVYSIYFSGSYCGEADKRLFLGNSHFFFGIWYIGEPENIIASGTYKPDVAQKLIEHARDEFDYVIVDAGENLNNGLTMGALNVEDKDLITVLNQRESNVKGLEMRLKLLVKMGIEIGKLLMNMYDGTDPYDIKYMSERLGMDKGDIISIPYTYELKECEREHDVLQDRNKLFHREMSKFIESYYGGPVREKRRLLGKILC